MLNDSSGAAMVEAILHPASNDDNDDDGNGALFEDGNDITE